jgi:hypothetical protein
VYTLVPPTDPIRQGDIFRWLPKIEVILGDEGLPVLTDQNKDGVKEIDWLTFAHNSEDIATATVSVRSVQGIVVSQDCDAARAQNIAFCEIRPFSEIEASSSTAKGIAKVVEVITTNSRKNQKWYYLAPDERLNFIERMGVDFQSMFQVNSEMLKKHIELLRLGRVCDDVAWPHFRERVAEFFRRYPYNEWYPLNNEEVKVYDGGKGRVDIFYPWQQD